MPLCLRPLLDRSIRAIPAHVLCCLVDTCTFKVLARRALKKYFVGHALAHGMGAAVRER